MRAPGLSPRGPLWCRLLPVLTAQEPERMRGKGWHLGCAPGPLRPAWAPHASAPPPGRHGHDCGGPSPGEGGRPSCSGWRVTPGPWVLSSRDAKRVPSRRDEVPLGAQRQAKGKFRGEACPGPAWRRGKGGGGTLAGQPRGPSSTPRSPPALGWPSGWTGTRACLMGLLSE